MKHIEQHFSGSDTVRDVVVGMADGLTVLFALTIPLQRARRRLDQLMVQCDSGFKVLCDGQEDAHRLGLLCRYSFEQHEHPYETAK